MFADGLLLIVALVFLVKGGTLFVSAAVRIAEILQMPRVVIGSTLVSLATTTPELVVSMTAASRGTADLAVGNAVGSCVCNIGLILGITATIKRVEIHPRALRTALLAMVGLGLALFAMTIDRSLDRWQGALLLLAGGGYFAYDFIATSRKAMATEIAEAKAISQAATKPLRWVETRSGTALQFVAAAAIVVFASRILVDAAVGIAARLGISPLVIGLTVVAIGTSLPELVTAIGSARREVSDLSVGNILGANIANLSLVIGAAAVLMPVPITRTTQLFDLPAMLAFMALLAWSLWTHHRLTRREGVVLLTSYAAYIVTVLIIASK